MSGATLKVQVSVPTVWDTARLKVSRDITVAQLKERALEVTSGMSGNSGDFVIKYRGARIFDESRTLADLDVPDGAPFIVLTAKRTPVS